MRRTIWLAAAVLALGGCSTAAGGGLPYPGAPHGDVVVVADEDRDRGGREHARSPGAVPPGHYPPPGECRIWYANRPPGQQPPPGRCDALVGRVPVGAFLLYNDEAWDTEYDWRGHEARRPGSVPRIVLRIMSSLVHR